MPISNITNGESGLSVRTSLNQVIDAVNASPPISNPNVIYVTTDGNDGTAEIGNPAKPFLNLYNAYTAGVNAGSPFIINMGVGSFILSTSNGSNFSALCLQLNGAGFAPASPATSVAINCGPAEIENQNGLPGSNVSVAINNLSLSVDVLGQNVRATDGGNYTAGDGGNVAITGFGSVVIDVTGGNGGNSTSGTVVGGNAGSIIISGPIIANGNLLSAKGLGYFDADGSDGPITLDNCDIRGATIQTSALTLGRCSYTSGIAVTNDKGGNAAW